MEQQNVQSSSEINIVLHRENKSKGILRVTFSQENEDDIEQVRSISNDLKENSVYEETDKVPWSELTPPKKVLKVCEIILKIVVALLLIYLFVCSLDLLSVGFRILGGREPQKLLRLKLLDNHVVGLMCGILFTLVVQSSSTTTSAVVGLVAGKILPIRSAIPIIMGANIGTSVTNTLFSMMQVADRNKFRRAFAVATVHDMFNWLTTLVLLPLESLTGYLYYSSNFLVQEIVDSSVSVSQFKMMKTITEPLTSHFVKLDKNVISKWNNYDPVNKDSDHKMESAVARNASGHIFTDSKWRDAEIGGLVIAVSFILVLTCMFLLVKLLRSALHGKIAVWIRRASNSNLPNCPKLTDYLLMLMGALLTFVVQSSSAFTSTLPPLAAAKALTLQRAYALTLGSNVGTTTTAIIASLSQTESKNFQLGLQIAFCHLIFNLTGVVLFFPIPCSRLPIQMSMALGNTTAEYRWFAIFYVLILFIILPLIFMGLAWAGSIYVIAVAVVIVALFLAAVSINHLRKYPRFLPKVLHTWNWLPAPLRSLEPYDRLFRKCVLCHRLIHLANSSKGVSDNERPSDNSEPQTEVLEESLQSKSLKTHDSSKELLLESSNE